MTTITDFSERDLPQNIRDMIDGKHDGRALDGKRLAVNLPTLDAAKERVKFMLNIDGKVTGDVLYNLAADEIKSLRALYNEAADEIDRLRTQVQDHVADALVRANRQAIMVEALKHIQEFSLYYTDREIVTKVLTDIGEIYTMTKIKNAQAYSIVRLSDGRIGIAPNRGSKGKYTVLIGEGYGVALAGDDEVQVLQLGVNVAFQRAMEFAASELTRTLREHGLTVHKLLPSYGQIVAQLQRGDGSLYEAYYVVEVERSRMRAVLDYAQWETVPMTAPAIVTHILQDQAELARRTWPDNKAWHMVTLCQP